jgi:hypothetical protein
MKKNPCLEKSREYPLLINHPICPFEKCNNSPEFDKEDPNFCNCCNTHIY